tara:strand:- start:200 stop:469 length:270 start_codon:yes stop_codon:yes gene_type:complete
MCLFRQKMPSPMASAPPIEGRNDAVNKESILPTKKDLVDKDEVSQVEYGTGQKEGATAKKTGAKQLRIPLNTGTQNVANTGGVTGGTTV